MEVARRDSSNREAGTATLVRDTRAAPRPLAAIVRVVGAGGAKYRLKSGACRIGAAPGNEVVVDEPTVSRQHAELTLVPEGVNVRDLGSRNGTFYLGQRVRDVVLSLGAHIHVGKVEIAIDADVDALSGGALYEDTTYRGMIGHSASMRRLFAQLLRLEGSLAAVLVQGESGVGKELVARALHEASPVCRGPLVAVNCGAIARELVASELFGHARGAFTGATDARKGAFESADGGTLFLDEIGELPLDVQPVLLRALETGEVRPVGGDRARRVRVRVIAATNRDLVEETRAGRFREDLYYRLAVVKLAVLPLRERREDIEPLARAFAERAGLSELDARVVEALKAREWPGNARELRNAVETYAALGTLPEAGGGSSGSLEAALEELADATRPYAEQKEALCDRFTRVYLRALMRETAGNQTTAARLAGLDRTYLGKLLAKHGLSKP